MPGERSSDSARDRPTVTAALLRYEAQRRLKKKRELKQSMNRILNPLPEKWGDRGMRFNPKAKLDASQVEDFRPMQSRTRGIPRSKSKVGGYR